MIDLDWLEEKKASFYSKVSKAFSKLYGPEVVMACFARVINDPSGFSGKKFLRMLTFDMVSKAKRVEVVAWYTQLLESYNAQGTTTGGKRKIPRVVNARVGGAPN